MIIIEKDFVRVFNIENFGWYDRGFCVREYKFKIRENMIVYCMFVIGLELKCFDPFRS